MIIMHYPMLSLIQVPLGILAKNENKGDDMVDIMEHLHQYVPVVNFSEDVSIEDKRITVPRAVMYPILFGGDQLTAARGRGAQKARTNSLSPLMRFDGLIPCAEDWHTKVIFLEVIGNHQ